MPQSLNSDELLELSRRSLYAPVSRGLVEVALEGAAAETLTRLAARANVRSGGGQPLRFARPGADAMAYEERIYRTGDVATRPGDWHDLFNALVWLAFPKAKAALNRRHQGEGSREAAGRRGPRRDAATLLDEEGALVACDQAAWQLLAAHRWKELFWAQRDAWRAGARLLVIGHAAYDKLRVPFVGLCVKAVHLPVDSGFAALDAETQCRHADDWLAERLADDAWCASPRSLAPLPVLGMPGVVPESEREGYYDDRRQFR